MASAAGTQKEYLKQPMDIAKRFYYDTILHSAPVLEFMIGHVGADRVMLGSDYPYDMGMMDCVKHVRVAEDFRCRQDDNSRVHAQKLCYRGSHERPGRQSRREFQRLPLHGLIVDAMSKAGVPRIDAGKIAELMLEADLIGADAHGVFRLPQYVQRLKLDSTNPRPNITVKRTAPATALVDGDNGMGHLVVARAAETAIELARECGVAWVGCRMSGHAGAAGVYAALPLKADMVGSLFGGGECQSHAARRRRRTVARHKSSGDRDPCGQGSADCARHRHLDRVRTARSRTTACRTSRCKTTG